jgi:hypothetical protein
MMKPIVVRPGDVDGPVAADNLAKGKSESRVKDGGLDTNVFEKFHPAVGPNFIKRAGLEIVQVGRMQMIQRRKGVEETVGVVFGSISGGHEIDDGFSIFDHVTVAVDDRLAIEWHRHPPNDYLDFNKLP